jgi:hypothetical protein
MPPDSLPPPLLARELNRRRESTRVSLLRANTAVAVVLVTVLLLALAATWQGLRATRLQNVAQGQRSRAETAEVTARADLWRALLAEARGVRLGQTLDRRANALNTLRPCAGTSRSC